MNNRLYMTPEGAKAVFQTFNRVFRTRIPEQAFIWDLIRPDGTLRSVEVSVSLIKTADGSIQGFRGTVRDITERKRAEDALRAAEVQFRGLFENVPDGVYRSTPEGKFLLVNPALAQMLGYASAEELLAIDISYDMYADPAARRAWTARLLQEGELRNVEIAMRRKDGQPLVGLENTRVVRDERGDALYFEGTLTDITARKRAEEALRVAEANYRDIFENAVEGIYQSSPQGRFIKVNSTMARILGYASPDEVITSIMSIRDQFYADSGRRTTAMQQLEQTGALENFESECLRKDGSRIWISENVRAVRDANGIPLYYEGFVQDITERKRAEDVLSVSEERFQSLFLKSPIGIGLADSEGRFFDVNEAFCQMLGYSRDELLGLTVLDLTYPDDRQRYRSLSEDVTSGASRGYQSEKCYVMKDGTTLWVNVTTARISAPDGAFLYGLGMVEDITERKRAEEERERLFQEVQRAGEQLQALSRRLVETQETERRRIARELHDEIGQVLTGLKMLLETSSHLPADTLRARLSNAQSLVEQLMERVQRMSLDLRPTMLDDLGLLPALLWLTKRFADQTGVRVNLEHSGLGQRFAPEIETAAYRIVQEALTNVARHADVKEATARLWTTQDTLHVQVEDRGKGFHVQAVLAAPTSSGLSGMRERAIALGGNLMIESTPGVGTHVTLQVPLSGSLERRTQEGRE